MIYNVSLETSYSALWLIGSVVLQKAYLFFYGSDESHEHGGSGSDDDGHE